MSNWDSINLENIARELKSIRYVLERMAQAPMFNETEVAYICDNRACNRCTDDDCMHTTNIKHAWNFEYKDGKYIEVVRKE